MTARINLATLSIAGAAFALGIAVASSGGPSGAAVAATARAAPSGPGCSAQQIAANRELALLFDMKKDWKVAYAHMAPDYIQHNPVAFRIGQVNGVSGRDEFKLLMDLKDKGQGGPRPRMPGQPEADNAAFVMADCDHVFLLKKDYLPDPTHPGQFYEAFDFDFWRIRNGVLAEHWDGGRIPANPPPMMTTPMAQLPPPHP